MGSNGLWNQREKRKKCQSTFHHPMDAKVAKSLDEIVTPARHARDLMAEIPMAGIGPNDLQADDFNLDSVFDGMFPPEHGVNDVQCFGVEIAFAAFGANFGFDVFHDVEPAVEPVMLGHASWSRLAVAKFTLHDTQSFA